MTEHEPVVDDQELYIEILWVLRYYGSDARERAEPGSKQKAQAARIVQFVEQRECARERTHDLHLIKVVTAHTYTERLADRLDSGR